MIEKKPRPACRAAVGVELSSDDIKKLRNFFRSFPEPTVIGCYPDRLKDGIEPPSFCPTW
jgi:hypothetical protein